MPLPAFSAAVIRAAEQPHLAAGRGESLMRRAAAGLAAVCRRALRSADGLVTGKRIIVLTGPGNNGGDALFCAAHLARRGAHVTVIAPFGRAHTEGLRHALRAGARLFEDANRDGARTTAAPLPDSAVVEAPLSDAAVVDAARLTARADLVIDGLLGIGARPHLEALPATLIREWQNAQRTLRRTPLVVAVDVPTGVDATTGQCGDVHVKADITVTFGGRKAGLYLPGGAEASGTIEFVDIGLGPGLGHGPGDDLGSGACDDLGNSPGHGSDTGDDLGNGADDRRGGEAPEPAAPQLWVVGDEDLRDWPQPGPHDHKYTRGVLGVIAGSQQYPGAGVLTCRAAVNAGVGMLRVQGAKTVQDAVVARIPEAVTAPGRVQAWTIGPGAPEPHDVVEFLSEAIGTGTPLVLDAGALALLPALLSASGGGPAAGGESPLPAATVLTPHAGELTELLTRIDDDAAGLVREDVEANPVTWVLRAASLTGAVVLLKGHRTLIATPDGRTWAPTPGPANLATAGSGDVLAGLIGAALATGLKDTPAAGSAAGSAAELAALAVVLHGRAARRARSASGIAAAVTEELSAVQSHLGGHPDAR